MRKNIQTSSADSNVKAKYMKNEDQNVTKK